MSLLTKIHVFLGYITYTLFTYRRLKCDFLIIDEPLPDPVISVFWAPPHFAKSGFWVAQPSSLPAGQPGPHP